MSRATYGTVEVELGKKKYVLKPTLAAYEKIENRMGGIRQALENCSNMSIDGIASIIAAGAGIGSRETKELKEGIFAEGTLTRTGMLNKFRDRS